ncbi:alpha-L-fucosidase 2 [Sarocladium implicatum]|nr:alpha-L-fucosidase 2 [Sarocladium implicatum]
MGPSTFSLLWALRQIPRTADRMDPFNLFFLVQATGVLLLTTAMTASAQNLTRPNSASHPLRIWQTSPGALYNESFLIGNGRIGAAVSGTVASENIPVNDDSLWSGGKMDRVNPDAQAYMPHLQELIRQGEVVEANRLASLAYLGTPESMRHFDFMGDLQIAMAHGEAEYTRYERWLDVEEAVAGVYYEIDGVSYTREYLASNPEDIISVRISASKPGAVAFRVHLRRGTSLNRFQDYGEKVGSDTVVMGSASGGVDGIAFVAGAKVVASGGSVKTIGDRIIVEGADAATVYFTSWTSYRKDNLRASVLGDLDRASKKAYGTVKEDHVKDYQSLAGRVELNLGVSTSEQKAGTTLERMGNLAESFDPELVVLYYQFGRYLFISTSRDGYLPPNLQGLWNDESDPFWGSKYTININLEMNYWPALTTNLAELNKPLLDFIKRIHESGKDTAKRMYNSTGSVAHHNVDVWADTAPQDNYFASTFWPSGLAWLVTHAYEHYRYTGDKEVLQEMYPAMRDAAQFYLDFMTEYKGYMVTNPSSSPEHAYFVKNSTEEQVAITLGPTCDNSIIWELFGIVLETHAVLGTDDKEFEKRVSDIRSKLPPLRVNSYGGIMEWIEDYKEVEPGHRHYSHLFGLYPGNQISSANSKFFDAAATSLGHRLSNGGGDTGWSRAWSISLAARLFNSTEVGNSLTHLLFNLTYPTSMLDTGPPSAFQLDGNYGGVAGISEALIQSHELVSDSDVSKVHYLGDVAQTMTVVRLLPALPKEWAKNGGGYAKGLRARGGFEFDLEWDEDGVLTGGKMKSFLGNTVYLMVGGQRIAEERDGKILGVDGSKGMGKLETRKGETYKLTAQ